MATEMIRSGGAGVVIGVGRVSEGSFDDWSSSSLLTFQTSFFTSLSSSESFSGKARWPYRCLRFTLAFLRIFQSDSGFPAINFHQASRSFLSGITLCCGV